MTSGIYVCKERERVREREMTQDVGCDAISVFSRRLLVSSKNEIGAWKLVTLSSLPVDTLVTIEGRPSQTRDSFL